VMTGILDRLVLSTLAFGIYSYLQNVHKFTGKIHCGFCRRQRQNQGYVSEVYPIGAIQSN
jgi:hypothetical protein